MCQAIRFQKNEFPEKKLTEHGLLSIADEIKIFFAQKDALIPILYQGENQLVPWGNKGSSKIPHTGFCKKESLELGKWQWLNPVPIVIIASSALMNGTWFHIREGIHGLLIENEYGKKHGYILTQPSTHYFKTMTGAERMPVLVNQIL